MRVPATTLESFRLFSEPDQEWMSEADLLATIRKDPFTRTPEMEIGDAFDAVLNTPDKYRVEGGYEARGHFFSDAMMTPALAVFDRRGVFQCKGVTHYPEATVVAKADQIVGVRLVENKTTFSSFDFDKYAASYQWRLMADMFLPRVVTYNVFLLAERKGQADTVYPGDYELRGIESFHLYPYDGLHQDCRELVTRFVDYVRRRGLEGHLADREDLTTFETA